MPRAPKTWIEIPCLSCGVMRANWASIIATSRFCSKQCEASYENVDMKCPVCARPFKLARSTVVYREKRGKPRDRMCCSVACSSASPDHVPTCKRQIRTDPQRCAGRCGQEYPLADYPKLDDGTPMLRCRACVQPKPELKRESHIRKKFGISMDAWIAIYTSQNGACAICRKVLPSLDVLNVVMTRTTSWSERNWNTDHCHRTGKVRGILCRLCNVALGAMRDSPHIARACATYLDAHRVCQHLTCADGPSGECLVG